jgi:hypothetical protein
VRFPALIGVCLFALSPAALAAKDPAAYASAAAKDHVGELATVTGRVSGVHVTAKGDTFINLGEPYPDNDFTIVVFSSDVAKFDDLEALQGRIVSATGTIKKFHEKPEIVLKTPDLLKVKPE